MPHEVAFTVGCLYIILLINLQYISLNASSQT